MNCHAVPISLLQEILQLSNVHEVIDHIKNQVLMDMTEIQKIEVDFNQVTIHSLEHKNFANLDPDLSGLQVFDPNSIQNQSLESSSFESSIDNKNLKKKINSNKSQESVWQHEFPILSEKAEQIGSIRIILKLNQSLEEHHFVYLKTISTLLGLAIDRFQHADQTKKMMQELRASQERLNLAIKGQHIGIWDWDIPNNRIFWDDTMFDIYGIAAEDFPDISQQWEKSVHPEDWPKMSKLISEVFTQNAKYEHQFRIFRNGEMRYLNGAGIVLKDENNKAIRFTGMNWDVTEKVLAANRLEIERAKSVSQAKMAALGEMASGIAHEINNPITIILNRFSLIKKMAEENNFNHALMSNEIDKIETTFHRIVKIIRGLKAFSRNADRDPKISCDINSIIDETLELCSERLREHGVQLKLIGMDSKLYFSCRPSQISQVLLNLLNNSFDAIENSEQPWITIEIASKESSKNLSFVIIVTDSGQGIPETVRQKMMDPFFTTKEVGKGTGLGLPISKGIIEEHGGTLIYDAQFKNTRFIIELPLEEEIPSSSEKANRTLGMR